MIEVQARPAYQPAGTAMTGAEAALQAEYPGSAFGMPAGDGVYNSSASYQPIGPIPTGPPPVGVPGNPGGPLPGGGGLSLASLMQQLVSLIGSLLGALGGGPIVNPFGGGNGNQQFYSNASANSQGDPHLSFSGTSANGTQVGQTWNNMESHPDLLTSSSFAGGYRMGAQVTPVAANGTTMNQQVTITTDGGATTVGMDNAGNIAIYENGSQVAIQAGQTVALGNGESVTENGDGSLTVNDTANNGGTIATTLSAAGGGVNISTTAADVFLGGYLARAGAGAGGGPIMTPYRNPVVPLQPE